MNLKGLKTSIIVILVIFMIMSVNMQTVNAQDTDDNFGLDNVDIPNIGDIGISYIDPYISIAYDAISYLLEDATEDFIMEIASEDEPPTNALRFLRSADVIGNNILGLSRSFGNDIVINEWPSVDATNEYEIIDSTPYITNSYTGQIPVEYEFKASNPYDESNDILTLRPTLVSYENDIEGYRPLYGLDAVRMGIHYAHFFLSQNDKTYITYPVSTEDNGRGPLTMVTFINKMLSAVQQTFSYDEGGETKTYTYDLVEWDGNTATDEIDVDGDGIMDEVSVTDNVRNFPVFMWALGAITYMMTVITFPEFCFGYDGSYGYPEETNRLESNDGTWGAYDKWHGSDDILELADPYYESMWFGFGPADLYRDWSSAEYITAGDIGISGVDRIIYHYEIVDYSGENSLKKISEVTKSLWDYKESGAAFGITDSKDALSLYMDLSTRASSVWFDKFSSIASSLLDDEYRTVFQVGSVITRLCYMLYWINDLLIGLGNNQLIPPGNWMNIVMLADCIGIIALVAIIKFKTGSIIDGKVDVER